MDNLWKPWIWTEEKPYPETLDTRIRVKLDDGEEEHPESVAEKVGWWYGSGNASSFNPTHCNGGGLIVAYKVMK